MAKERRRREALGVGLAALGLLVALAVIPEALGAPEASTGNPVGPAGAALHGWLSLAFGAAAFLVTVPAFAWSLYCFGGFERSDAVRWSVLAVAALVLLPAGGWLVAELTGGEAAGAAGWTGTLLGSFLLESFGAVGGLIILAAVLLAVSVLTLGLSPTRGLRNLLSWSARGGEAGVRSLRSGADRVRRLTAELAARLGGPSGSPWESAPDRSPEVAETSAAEPTPAEEAAGTAAGAADPVSGDAIEQGILDLRDTGDPTQTRLPPKERLSAPATSSRGLDRGELKKLGGILIEKLKTFRVEGEIRGWTTGPVVTQFEVVPAAGVKVGQIAALADDLALALKAPSVRIVAPIPGKGAVGVEVPNPEPQVVYVREILESEVYARSRAALPLALGRDLSGEPYCADLARMPHLLIAGATGSGKSVCINTIITSLIYRYTPRELRLLMIDPKMVELSVYDDLPHLRHPVVTDNQEAASILKWAVYEMNRRYALLSANGARSLPEFNRQVREGETMRKPDGASDDVHEDGELPFVVLVIDELADLMMTVQSEVESPLALLAQKARAVGIHLVIATQRPSVNVITGLIKANFPSRIAFRVASKTDSRTILDQNGAESLLGNGDMLFRPPGEGDPVRIQGAYITSRDTERLVGWYRAQASQRAEGEMISRRERDVLEVVEEMEEEEARVDVVEEVLEDRDELFRQAAEVVITSDSGSTSLLQRRLRIGYGRAARIIDQLHHAGVVGPSEGSRPREVLVTLDQLDDVLKQEEEAGEEAEAHG